MSNVFNNWRAWKEIDDAAVAHRGAVGVPPSGDCANVDRLLGAGAASQVKPGTGVMRGGVMRRISMASAPRPVSDEPAWRWIGSLGALAAAVLLAGAVAWNAGRMMTPAPVPVATTPIPKATPVADDVRAARAALARAKEVQKPLEAEARRMLVSAERGARFIRATLPVSWREHGPVAQ